VADRRAPARAAASPALATVAACLLGAQAIHVAVMPSHFRQWWAAGAFFLVVAVLEGGLAVAILVAPSRRLGWAIVAASLATVAVWLESRTLGVPFGPQAWVPEPVGRADVVATALELATALALVGGRRLAALRLRVRVRPSAAAALIALVTAFGAIGAGDAHSHAHRGPLPPLPPGVNPP
jgi:hypothetical protein